MMKRIVYPLLAVLMVACSSVDCPVDSTVATLYQIRNSDGTELKLVDTMTVRTVDAESNDLVLYNGRDSIIYNKGDASRMYQSSVSCCSKLSAVLSFAIMCEISIPAYIPAIMTCTISDPLYDPERKNIKINPATKATIKYVNDIT